MVQLAVKQAPQLVTKQALKTISLIIPVYNEADNLLTFLERIDTLSVPLEKELIFINDCSTDSSGAILSSYAFRSNARVIHFEKNQGKGAAIRTGIELATGDIIGVQDADFEYDSADIAVVIQPLLEGRADVCYGSRYKNSEQVHRTYHYLVNRMLTLLSNVLSGMYLTDMETCYKFFKAEIIKNINLESNRFGFEPEITAKVARLKVKVTEVPISYFPRNYMEGKKITWKDGVAALRHIFYFNCIQKSGLYRKDLPEKYLPKGRQWL